jgi:hypothetical protein
VANFTVTNDNNPSDAAILASSVGEGLHAETTAPFVAAVAAIQLDTTPDSRGAAVYGECRGGGSGLYAECQGDGNGVFAKVNNPNGIGAAIYAEHSGNKVAGYFKGDVIVTGDVSFPGKDCAEEFAVAAGAVGEPGTLMVMGAGSKIEPSTEAYDRTVVGVVSGAGEYRPGIVLGRDGTDEDCRQIALVGRAYCKADATYGAIETGDLLTSSETLGHAMRAGDFSRAFGAVIGKAMAPLDRGRGLIPMLISLQ